MYKSALLSLLLLVSFGVQAEGEAGEVVRNFTKTFDVSPSTLVFINAFDTELDLDTWDGNTVEVSIRLVIHAKDKAEAELFADQAAPTLTMGGDQITISNQICARKTVVNNGVTKIWFQDGNGKITIEDYHYSMTIKMPKVNPLQLKSHYSALSIEDLAGKVDLNLMDCDLRAGDMTGGGKIKARYGESACGDLTSITSFELFEEEFSCGQMGNPSLYSRYSDIRCGKADRIDLKSFDDDIYLEQVNVLRGKASYSKLQLKSGEELDLELFETDIDGEDWSRVDLEAKYSKIELHHVGELDVEDFENKYDIQRVGSLEADTKYSKFEIGQLTQELDFDGFDAKIEVEQLDATVTVLRVKGKYLDVELVTGPGMAYNLDVDLLYTKIDYPKEDFKGGLDASEDSIDQVLTSNKTNTSIVTFSFDCFDGSIEIIKS